MALPLLPTARSTNRETAARINTKALLGDRGRGVWNEKGRHPLLAGTHGT